MSDRPGMQDPDIIELWQRTMGTRLDALEVAPARPGPRRPAA